jgi:hypothetical protein
MHTWLTDYYTVLYLSLLNVSTPTRHPQGVVTRCLLSYIKCTCSLGSTLEEEEEEKKNNSLTCNLASTEWELNEDDALALKHVGAINKDQYNKLSIKCAFIRFLIHIVKDARYQGLKKFVIRCWERFLKLILITLLVGIVPDRPVTKED